MLSVPFVGGKLVLTQMQRQMKAYEGEHAANDTKIGVYACRLEWGGLKLGLVRRLEG